MSKNYDNWGRLVAAVLRREQFRQLARLPSFSPLSSTSIHDSQGSSTSSPIQEDQSFQLGVDYKYIYPWGLPAAHGNGKSKALEEMTRTCYMIGATDLEDSSRWKFQQDSSFGRVAAWRNVYGIDIRGTIEAYMLDTKTHYGAYLIFKLSNYSIGLGRMYVTIVFLKYDEDVNVKKIPKILYLQESTKYRNGRVREWMEIELGKFYYDNKDDGPVEVRLFWQDPGMKLDVIIAGIEVRTREENGGLNALLGLKKMSVLTNSLKRTFYDKIFGR